MASTRKQASSSPSWSRRALRFSALILLFCGGIVFGFLLPRSDLTRLTTFPGKIWLWQVAAFPVAILVLVILVHELGHLIAGLLVGFRFVLFAVGPVKLYADGPRLRLGLNRRLNVGGMTICVPRDTRQLSRRVAAMILAGPFSNLGLGVLIGIGFLLQPQLDLAGAFFLEGLAVISGIMGLLNLFPVHSKGFTSDGRRAWDLLRGTPEVGRWLAQWALLAAAAGGTRPADQDPALITQALSLPDDSIDHVSAIAWAYYAAFDQGQWAEARAWLAELQERLPNLPPPVQAGYWLEVAYFAAAIDRDAPAARDVLQRAKNPLMPSASTQARLDAALCLAEGQYDQAIQHATLGLELIERDPYPGMVSAERDWLTALIAAACAAVV